MKLSVVWFRRDLRLHDNEAVYRAALASTNCLFVFVVDPWFYRQPEIGWLRVRFLFESLAALDRSLRELGNRLVVLHGDTVSEIDGLLAALKGDGHEPSLFFNYDIQSARGLARDKRIVEACRRHNINVNRTNNFFLLSNEGDWDNWWDRYYEYQYAEQSPVPAISPLPTRIEAMLESRQQLSPDSLAQQLNFILPEARHAFFHGGEAEARKAVYGFLKDRAEGYHWKIAQPYRTQHGATSLLGPHLAFGTISSRTVTQAAANYQRKLEPVQPKKSYDITTYLDRLRWRDSFTNRLWFHPELKDTNRFAEFDDIYSWQQLDSQRSEYFERWKKGETGFPLLDAAMKQLASDGFINFRMRAMAATFLTINCRVSWHWGATYFMSQLVDGDIAINHWQWQMQAGITNPLNPVFRMYSPTKNFRERDPNAAYVHSWLPQTADKDVNTILNESQPMLNFLQTRKDNGKIVSDIRKAVRDRVRKEGGAELAEAQRASEVTVNFRKRSAERYAKYIKH